MTGAGFRVCARLLTCAEIDLDLGQKARLVAWATSRVPDGFASRVAVLQDETLSRRRDGTEPEVGQQPLDEPEVERAAHSRVEPLLVDEECFPDEALLA